MKYNLRTKTYIIIIILNLLAIISDPLYSVDLISFYSMLLKHIPLVINSIFVTLLYAISIILLFQEPEKIKKAGWILGITATATILLNPLPSLSTTAHGFLIGTVQGLLAGDAMSAAFNIASSIVPIILIIIAISMLAGCKNKKFDIIITIILAAAYILTRFLEPAIIRMPWTYYISPVITSAIFLTALLIWGRKK